MEHKNAEVIKAWADGKAIQFQSVTDGEWIDFRGENDPEPWTGPWSKEALCRWRVKPKEPEVVVKYVFVGIRVYGKTITHSCTAPWEASNTLKLSCFHDSGELYEVVAKISLTADAETGKILAVELMNDDAKASSD